VTSAPGANEIAIGPWPKLLRAWFAAACCSTVGATLGFWGSIAVRSGSADTSEVIWILGFSAIYATIASTVLGPPTLVILIAIRRVSARAFAVGGLLAGFGGMVALNAWSGTPQWNMFPETGAVAGLFGGAGFHWAWRSRARTA
jgi:hypothetical protein